MSKWLIPVLTASVVLGGCASVPRGSIPVVDSGSSAYEQDDRPGGGYNNAPAQAQQPQSMPEDSGVVVMVPGGGAPPAPIDTYAAPAGAPANSGGLTFDEPPLSSEPLGSPSYGNSAPSQPSTPSGIPSGNAGGGLAADEQLDDRPFDAPPGPVPEELRERAEAVLARQQLCLLYTSDAADE